MIGYITITPGGRRVQVDVEQLTRRIGVAVDANAINDQAAWTAAVGAVFNGTNASGLSPLARAFMIAFFESLVRIG
jgi:hypothetical protein